MSADETSKMIAYLARQQIMATAHLSRHLVQSQAATKEATLETLQKLIDTAERDATDVGLLGRTYANGLRDILGWMEIDGASEPDDSGITFELDDDD